jgi:hypothetical protein
MRELIRDSTIWRFGSSSLSSMKRVTQNENRTSSGRAMISFHTSYNCRALVSKASYPGSPAQSPYSIAPETDVDRGATLGITRQQRRLTFIDLEAKPVQGVLNTQGSFDRFTP